MLYPRHVSSRSPRSYCPETAQRTLREFEGSIEIEPNHAWACSRPRPPAVDIDPLNVHNDPLNVHINPLNVHLNQGR
eukprot:9030477-Pyramimonas_sp.AAC.1